MYIVRSPDRDVVADSTAVKTRLYNVVGPEQSLSGLRLLITVFEKSVHETAV